MNKKTKPVTHHPNPKPKDDSCQKESTNRHVYVEPGAKIDFVQDLREKYDAAQRGDKTHKDAQLFWTKVASGLLLLTAALGGIQIYQAHAQFLTDQRPYVWITQPLDSMGKIGNEFSWNVYFKNFGKSPAINVRCLMFLETGTDALTKVKRISKVPLTNGIVQPPNGSPDFNTGKPFLAATDAELNSLYAIDHGIVVYGRIDYSGTDGTEYWTLFCLSRQANGVISYCADTQFNQVH